MKTTKLFFLIALLAITASSKAQISVNVNLGTPPVWAPAAPVEVQYYYLPDIETYYDVPARRYIYMRNGVWTRTAYLPRQYRGYDLYHGHTVYLNDYHGNAPYSFYKQHKVKYVGNNWERNEHESGNHNRNWKDEGHGKGHGKGHNED